MRAAEFFGCAGGMAEGFRRAGIIFALSFDFSADACRSYAANLGHAPVQMDVRDVLRLKRSGVSFGRLDLIVADPPCTPWSRAGKRQGLEDEADMLLETCELIAELRPTCWLIGNVPGLDDSTNADAVAQTIGKLSRLYDVDYAKLNASSYGVPQHRVRPFWFGRPRGSEPIRWPATTHGAPGNLAIPGAELKPWVTCRDALSHLPLEQLGRPVRVKWKRDTDHKTATPDAPAPTATRNTHGDGALLSRERACNGEQLGSIPDRPARVVGTSILSDGNILVTPEAAQRPTKRKRPFHHAHPATQSEEPARTLTTKSREGGAGGGGLLLAANHEGRNNHPPSTADNPARTVTGSDGGGVKGHTLTWPWDVPATTVTSDDRLPPPGHHPESGSVLSVLSVPNAVVLSEQARAILQGFPPGWQFLSDTKRGRAAMIGMAMPPPMAEAVARSIVSWFAAHAARFDGTYTWGAHAGDGLGVPLDVTQ